MSGCGCNMTFTTDDDFNIYFPDGDGGGAVKSVNGKTGAVVLDAGDIGYDETAAYAEGSVGAEIKALQEAEVAVDDALSDTSENPVQNKVITEELDDLKAGLNNKADIIISSASGSIAHFEDGANYDAVDVIAYLEPVQDLHGYENPWPAGGGVNKVKLSEAFSSFQQGTYGFYVAMDGERIKIYGTYSGNNTSVSFRIGYFDTGTWDFTNLSVKGFVVSGLNSNQYYQNVVRYGNANKTDFAIDLLNITPNQQYTILIDVVFYEGSTAPTTWTPYSNECPITGHTGTNVYRTGKNLLRLTESEMVNSGWNRRFPFSINAGTYVISCQNQFGGSSNKGARVRLYDEDNTLVTYLANTFAFGNNVFTGTSTITEEQASKIRYILFECNSDGTTYESITNGNLQLELGTAATAYEPYNGTVYPITFPSEAGTVYGGYVDVTQGKLVVTDGYVDLGTLTWVKTTDNRLTVGYYFASSNIDNKSTKLQDIICENYRYIKLLGLGNIINSYGASIDKIVYTSSNKQLYIIDSQYTDADTLKADMNGVKLVYELATPIEYDLTPTAVELLKGTNNLWNDGNGDTDVTYKCDTKLYIEQLTKPTEDDMTANANIASGKFFMVGNRLFLSTATIASGDAIKPNTNCTEMSLADALNSL